MAAAEAQGRLALVYDNALTPMQRERLRLMISFDGGMHFERYTKGRPTEDVPPNPYF